MLFLVYSPLSSGNIAHSLGLADYSYYFVMQRFLPLLREFGEVEILAEPPSEEDVAQRQQSALCVYLSFTPPNKVASLTGCPVVPVFAWEYSSIPNEAFSNVQDNWALALIRSGTAITHSRYALDVVRAQLGEDYAIESIPAPIWDSYQDIRDARKNSPPRGLAGLNLECTIIDSNDYLISNTSIRPRQDTSSDNKPLLTGHWGGETLVYNLAGGEYELTLIGFNDPEPWGVWSRSGYPWVLFDFAIEGEVELTIRVRGYQQNIGQRLRLEMGSASADLLLSEKLQTHVFRMTIEQPTNMLTFLGVVERAVGAPDPRDIGIGLSEIKVARPGAPLNQPDTLVIDMAGEDLISEGLYDREDFGRWTSSSNVSIQLPTPVAGDLRLCIEVFHMLHNHQRPIDVSLGEGRQTLVLEDGRTVYEVDFFSVVSTDYVALCGLVIGPGENEEDPRRLGLGIARISLHRIVEQKQPFSLKQGLRDVLDSLPQLPRLATVYRSLRAPANILYTAIFNPKDGRKNWEDIITGFVYAFRDDEGATLLIKITYHDLGELYEDIFTFLIELHPFKCRLVFIHGFLSDEQYEQLLLHSHFIVNASRGEGQCLPLMEFMSAGVPAVAPDNTAMAEYIDSSNAFIVKSSPELTFWPQDPRQVFRTLWMRVDWESLVAAYSSSAKTYRGSRRAYTRMGEAAARAQQKYCSMAIARARFEKFLGHVREDSGE